jgi:hypothetical protein
MKHEEPSSQRIAGWYHVGFAVLYAVAIVWHLRGAFEHFHEERKSNGNNR